MNLMNENRSKLICKLLSNDIRSLPDLVVLNGLVGDDCEEVYERLRVLNFPSETFSSRMKLSPSRTLYVYNSLPGHFISSGPATFDKT